MRKILLGSVMAFALVSFIGCNESSNPAPKDTKSAKCASGKCGGDKKAPTSKCGGDKNKTTKCGGSK